MGKSNSKTSQVIENDTVNYNYVNTLNENIMNTAVNTLVSNANKCTSAVNQNNLCSMTNSKIGGDLVIGGTQSNTATVDFSCVNANQASSDMSTAMMTAMLSEIKALNGTEAAAKLNSSSDASNTSGFGSTGGSASAGSKTSVSNEVSNETITHIQNIFTQNLSNNFSSETVNDCIGKTTQTNIIDASGSTVGGNATVSCIQTNTLEQIQKCSQLSDAISKTTQETFQELGLKTSTENTTKTETEATNEAKSENVSTGPIGELGNLLGLASFAFLGPVLGPICAIISLIVCVIIIIMIVMALSGAKSKVDQVSNTGAISGSDYGSDYGSGRWSDMSSMDGKGF